MFFTAQACPNESSFDHLGNAHKILVTRQDCHRALTARYNNCAESSYFSIHCVVQPVDIVPEEVVWA